MIVILLGFWHFWTMLGGVWEKAILLLQKKKLNNILEQYPQHIDSWNHLAAVYEYSNRLTTVSLSA